MKNGTFVSHSPEKLALSIIKEIREQNRLEAWPEQLEKLSSVKSE